MRSAIAPFLPQLSEMHPSSSQGHRKVDEAVMFPLTKSFR